MYTSDHKLLLTSENYIPVEINKGIVIQRADTKSANEEVDNIIVQQMRAAVNQKGNFVLSVETGLIVFLLYDCLAQQLELACYNGISESCTKACLSFINNKAFQENIK